MEQNNSVKVVILTFTTARREWKITQSKATGLWSVYYRVINQKTGQAWQGIKHDPKVEGTHHAFHSYRTGQVGPITKGRGSWDNQPFPATSIPHGYLSSEAALEAIKARNV